MTAACLTLIDQATGELVDVINADAIFAAAGIGDVHLVEDEDLAVFIDNVDLLRQVSAEAKGIASDEFVTRMDGDGAWTRHLAGYDITAASPEAGTVGYDVPRLDAVLSELVSQDVISAAGRNAALECVKPTVAVPYALLREVRTGLEGELDDSRYDLVIAELESLLLSEPEPTLKLKPAGVKALLKLPAARAAIEACQVSLQPPHRVARVKRRTKGGEGR